MIRHIQDIRKKNRNQKYQMKKMWYRLSEACWVWMRKIVAVMWEWGQACERWEKNEEQKYDIGGIWTHANEDWSLNPAP